MWQWLEQRLNRWLDRRLAEVLPEKLEKLPPVTVTFARVDPTLPPPFKATPGSLGYDLYCRIPEDGVIRQGDRILAELTVGVEETPQGPLRYCEVPPRGYALIPLNVIVKVEGSECYGVYITGRSSIYRRKRSHHLLGVIDRDYSGYEDEIMAQVLNHSDEPVRIYHGDSIAQLLLLNTHHQAEWQEIPRSALSKKSRGGIGSTAERAARSSGDVGSR